MHTVVLSRARINRSSQALVQSFLPLSLLVCILLTTASLSAQDDGQGMPDDVATAPLSSASDNSQDNERRVKRLGDDGNEEEWELELTSPDGLDAPVDNLRPPDMEQEITSLLSAAQKAVKDGRIDQPEANCAWTYFRRAHDLDPGSQEAKPGLVVVDRKSVV